MKSNAFSGAKKCYQDFLDNGAKPYPILIVLGHRSRNLSEMHRSTGLHSGSVAAVPPTDKALAEPNMGWACS